MIAVNFFPALKSAGDKKGTFDFLSLAMKFSMALLQNKHLSHHTHTSMQADSCRKCNSKKAVPKAAKRNTDIFSLLFLKGSMHDNGNEAISGNPASIFCTAFLLTSNNLLIKGEMYLIFFP